MKAGLFVTLLTLAGCQSYKDFTLPAQPGNPENLTITFQLNPNPVLTPGPAGAWDSHDVLNPSIIRTPEGYLNLYSGFDGQTWRTGLATSREGINWTKQGQIFSPPDGGYIAANGSVISRPNGLSYYYQAGRKPHIILANQDTTAHWNSRSTPILSPGPYGSWDELGAADPYVLAIHGHFYLYYLGMDRAKRQRLGVAESADGIVWSKLRTNPILELGSFCKFDEKGLGEPAVFASHGYYWMLYTGRDKLENRRLGIARSKDGVVWEKLPQVFSGADPWDAKVLCDPAVLIEGNQIRVWFGGGDEARPDENIHGQIGYGVLRIASQARPRP